jgi:hypothetical protein
MSEHKTSMRVGDLNGKWSILLRFSLAAFPLALALMVGWATWVTHTLWQHDERLQAARERTEVAFANEARSRATIREEVKELEQRTERRHAELMAAVRRFRP